jgi:hypothetical protein
MFKGVLFGGKQFWGLLFGPNPVATGTGAIPFLPGGSTFGSLYGEQFEQRRLKMLHEDRDLVEIISVLLRMINGKL